ncbi:MAG: SusD/RagB family nutrient-binding outer membrane lipoprotein, partial [Cytophagales bacterium]|nr:SusD/RagB family nutrient-binding outer membrane lipoprotein [Cytophagales bacterium]
LQQDPNAVQTEQVLANLILNSIQRQLSVVVNAANTTGAQHTRLLNGAGTIYINATSPQTFDGLWTNAYAGILQDADQLITLADKNGFARHAGIARIIQSYTLILLTDMFGDVPFTEAFKGAANFNPKADAGAAIYDIALAGLDQAKKDLTTNTTVSLPAGYLNPVAPVSQDQYYGNNFNKWVRLANSLKLKAFLNLSLRQPDKARTEINALIADASPTGGFITTQDQNFIWRYGTTTSDPDGRHPRFSAQYPAGGGDYQSNWLIWHMFHAYNATQNAAPGDPRMRFYFYRQVTSNSSSSNEIRCLTETRPDHYPSSTGSAIVDNAIAGRPPMGVDPLHPTNNAGNAAWTRTFCQPTDRGYWGRDHVDPQGIPPDGLLRTAYGPYPVGGRFDNNAGVSVASTQGMRGAGLQPIMMRSFVEFMLAEASLTLGTTGSAVAYFSQGIDDSFADVRDWAVNGTYNTTAGGPEAGTSNAASPTEAATINAFYPAATYTADVANYRASAVAAFNSSTANALNYLAREYWVALVGNGYEAYNLYRRTGRPTGMQPVINPSPGPFPQSFWYPAVYATLNNTARQKVDLTSKVFWQVDSPPNINF